jgi:hypothetical protein
MKSVFKDPWNPTVSEIRSWAYSSEPSPDQDWILAVNLAAVNSVDCKNLLFELACERNCPKRKFFVHALYFFVGDAIRSYINAREPSLIANQVERLKQIKNWLNSLSKAVVKDVRRWQSESMQLIANPARFDYDYWCWHKVPFKTQINK